MKGVFMSPKLEDFETEGGEEVLEVVDKKTGRKYNRPNYSRYRNLKQFQDLSEDEIFEKMEFKKNTTRIDEQFEKRIQELTKNFSEDYDLEDMNYTLDKLGSGYDLGEGAYKEMVADNSPVLLALNNYKPQF